MVARVCTKAEIPAGFVITRPEGTRQRRISRSGKRDPSLACGLAQDDNSLPFPPRCTRDWASRSPRPQSPIPNSCAESAISTAIVRGRSSAAVVSGNPISRALRKGRAANRLYLHVARSPLPSYLIDRKADGGEGGQDVAGVADGQLQQGRGSF